MTYKVQETHGSFYVQYFRQGWKFFQGKEHIRFDTYSQAYDWIVKNKFYGNVARAQLHIYHA